MQPDKRSCQQCNKHFHKRLDGSVKLTYFDKKLYFCSHKCHHTYAKENFPLYLKWLKQHTHLKAPEYISIAIYPHVSNIGHYRKEYAWLITDMKGLISKKDAIKLYNRDPPLLYDDGWKNDYPELYKYLYRDAWGVSTLMLNVALRDIGEIE